MAKQIPTPSASALYEMFPKEAMALERAAIIEQLRRLGIEYKVTRNRYGLVIDIPTNIDGFLRITATNLAPRSYGKFFEKSHSKQLRLPNGKVLKSETQEIISATVDFISHGEHPDVCYLLKEPNFAEIIDTAIETLAQIDGIYLSPIQKNRGRRGDNPTQPPLQD